MDPKKIRNLIFDLGNVIIDLDEEKAFQSLDKLYRKDANRDLIDKVFIEFECGRVSSDIFINTLLSQSPQDVQALDIINAWNSMLIGIPEYRLEMLLMLRNNYNVYMLSNSNPIHIEWIHHYTRSVHHEDAFEKKYFDKVYYSHEVGFRKPMVGIYQHVIDDAILTPELSLFMDDKKENVAAAKRLGFKGYEVKAEKDIAEYLKVEGFY